MKSPRIYAIIGNGVAGMSAAEAIRKADPHGKILLITNEEVDYYFRASLSEWIEGKNTRAMMNGRTEAFFNDLRIDRIYDTIQVVDVVNQRLISEGGSYPYDELLVATGATPHLMSFPGCEQPLVYRGMADAARLMDSVNHQQRMLIVGGGVLGLEVAAALHKRGGCDCAIVHRSKTLSRPLLDHLASEWIATRIRQDGIPLFLEDELSHRDDGVFHLKSGTSWQGDVLLLTAGIEPIFPDIPGMEVGTGIRIDRNCATNLTHIYAAGDCTETFDPGTSRWLPSRTWLEAARQGKIAGMNMTGITGNIPPQPYFNASYIYKDQYVYIGEPHTPDGEIFLWQDANGYRKIRISKGIVKGALLINQRRNSLAIFQAIQQQIHLPYDDSLPDPAFEWNFFTHNDWDYRFF